MLLIESVFVEFFLSLERGFFVFEFEKAVSLCCGDHFSGFRVGLELSRVLFIKRNSGVFLPCFAQNFPQFIDLVRLGNIIDNHDVLNSVSFAGSLNYILKGKYSETNENSYR